MSANRMSLRFGTKGCKSGITISLKTSLSPDGIDQAVDGLSKELEIFSQDKVRLKRIVEMFAKENWEEYQANLKKYFPHIYGKEK